MFGEKLADGPRCGATAADPHLAPTANWWKPPLNMLLLRETGVKPAAPLCPNWDGRSSASRPVHSAVENEVDVNLVEHCDRTCGTRANESIPSRCDVYVLLRGRILRCYMDVVTTRYVYKLYRINNRQTNAQQSMNATETREGAERESQTKQVAA